MQVELLPRIGEIVHVDRDLVLLLLLVVGNLLVDPHDAHNLRDRRVEGRDHLSNDLGRFLRDAWEDELDDLELLPRLRAVGLLGQVGLEAAPALFEGEVQFSHDLVHGRHGLLGLRGEGDLRRADVHEDDRRAEGDALPPALLEAVAAPVHLGHSLRQRAAARLVHERDAVREAKDFHGLVRKKVPSVDDAHLHLEGVARVDGRFTGHGGCIKLRTEVPEDVLQPSFDESLADRAEAVRRRGHELRLLHGLVEGLRLLEAQAFRPQFRVQARGLADFLGDPRGDADELLLEERGEFVGLRLLHHLHEGPELDAVGVRRDRLRLWREFLRGPLEDQRLPVRWLVRDAGVGIHDGRGLEILRNGLFPSHVAPLQRDLHAGSVGAFPNHPVLAHLDGQVLLRVEDELDEIRGILLLDLGQDLRGLARGQLAVHDRATDAQALLAAAILHEDRPSATCHEVLVEPIAGDREVVDPSRSFRWLHGNDSGQLQVRCGEALNRGSDGQQPQAPVRRAVLGVQIPLLPQGDIETAPFPRDRSAFQAVEVELAIMDGGAEESLDCAGPVHRNVSPPRGDLLSKSKRRKPPALIRRHPPLRREG